jgi:hypothetical protein
VLLCSSVPRLVRADAPRVRVSIAAEPGEMEALLSVIAELMQRLGVELEVDRTGHDLGVEQREHIARCSIDMREPEHAVLLVHDPARDHLLVRRVARTPGRQELVREELGHMMLAAVEALLAGATVGVPREEALRAYSEEQARDRAHAKAAEAAPPLPPAAAPAVLERDEEDHDGRVAQRTFQMSGALLYEVAALGHTPGVTHGPALAIAVRSPWPLGLGVLGSVQYRLPFEIEPEPVGMRTQIVALRALATIEGALTSKLTLRFGLGAGVDVARLEPLLATGASARATEDRTLALAVARALAGIAWRASSVLSLWVALAADADLDRSQYVVVADDGNERTVSEPWRLRPALLVGAALP